MRMLPDVRESIDKRICFVCKTAIPQRDGTFHAGLRILCHSGKCSDFVTSLMKDFSKSRRGKFRRRADILRDIREAGTAFN
jgi:hypothetical protein